MTRGKSSLLFLLVYLSASLGLPAVAAPTEGPASKAFGEWLLEINSRNPKIIQAFIDKYARKSTVDDALDLNHSFGRLAVLRSTTISPNEVHVLMRGSASDSTLLVTLIVDPARTNRFAKLQLEGVDAPDEFRIARLPLRKVLAATRARFANLRKENTASGALIVAQGDRIVYRWTGGKADREHGIANDLDTKFRLGSMNKMFTSVAILQLMDAGKLSLDDPIAKHLENYPDPSIAQRVTVRQLLTHTSGLGDIFDEDYPQHIDQLRTHDDYVRMYGSKPLLFEPGSAEAYSNFGFIVLGAIVEAASGSNYYDYVDEHIYRPAGMTGTGSEPESTGVAGRANAYTKGDPKKGEKPWVRETMFLPWRGMAAGGGYSTVGDLLRFSQALRQGRLLSTATFDAATHPQNLKGWYGYGFSVGGRGTDRHFGHDGGAPGMNAALTVTPANDYTVIGLSNFDPNTMDAMVQFVSNRLPMPAATR